MSLMPGGACLRLYSAMSSIRQMRSAVSAAWPRATISAVERSSSTRPLQHVVEHVVGGERVLIGLVGAQLRARRLVDDRFGNHRPLRSLEPLHPAPVAPARHLEHGGLVDVLQDRIAAAHVAVERGVAHRHLRLVAGGEHHVAELVADRHQDDAAHPRLDVLLGLVRIAALRRARRACHPSRPPPARSPPPRSGRRAGARIPRRRRGRTVRRVARRHGDAEDAVRAQRIDRDGGRQRRINAAGKPDQHAGEAVLADIVGEPHRHGAIGGRVSLRQRRARARLAGPAIALARPAGEGERFLERRRLGGEAVVGVEHERGAIKDELVLPAHLVHVDQRQLRLADAGDGEVEPCVALVALEGRAR